MAPTRLLILVAESLSQPARGNHMSTLGEFGGLPFTLGGEDSVDEIAKNAMLAAIEPYLDAYDAFVSAEARAHASGVRLLWDCSERLKNEAIPERMMDALPAMEEALHLRPTPAQTNVERRAAVAAGLKSLPNNAIPDIQEAMIALLGSAFVALHTVDASNAVTFWPAINPGPPGYEWSSNWRMVGVELSKQAFSSDAELQRKVAATQQLLNRVLPTDMVGVAVVGDGGVFDVDVFDLAPFGP